MIHTFEGAAGNALTATVTGPWPGPDPVLLAHGGGQTRHAWGRTVRGLAQAGSTAIAIDQRGHGDSAWVATGAYALDDFAADLAAVATAITERCGAPPLVVGASLGGLAAMLSIGEGFAPARALVLVDVTPHMRREGVEKVQGFMAERAAEGFETLEAAADAIARYLPHRPRPRSLDGLRKNLRQGDDGRWRWHWDPRFISGPRNINHGHPGTADRVAAAASRIRLPTLLIRGGASELVGPEETQVLRQLVPHAEFVDVADAHHMVAGDSNDAFTNQVLSFNEAQRRAMV